MHTELIPKLKTYVSEKRYALFQKVLQYRTTYITVGIEDIYQSHNASAVVRSCDCFGIQNVHILEKQNQFITNPEVDMGASKWLSIHKYPGQNAIDEAYTTLRKQNYRIVATTPHTNETNLEDFDLTKGPAALFFGTEMRGLSSEAIEKADEYLKIPMYGFTESFNISVSAAIILHHLREKLNSSAINWSLSPEAEQKILYNWLCASIKRSGLIVKRLLKEGKSK